MVDRQLPGPESHGSVNKTLPFSKVRNHLPLKPLAPHSPLTP